MEFKKGDPIAWVSGFGWDVGYWIEAGDATAYNHDWIDLRTGKIKGRTLRSRDQIHLLTWDLVERLDQEWGYDLSKWVEPLDPPSTE
jgi:hypothetical protein